MASARKRTMLVASVITVLLAVGAFTHSASAATASDKPTVMADEIRRAQELHHAMVFSCFSYSHCLEVFGVALTLVDTGKFKVTLVVLEPCRKVVDRLLQVTLYPDHISVVHVEFDSSIMQRMLSKFKPAGVLSDNWGNKLHTEERREQMKNLMTINDEFLRHNNFSNITRIHEQHPFDVAICSAFSAACFEFADRVGIVGIAAGIQGVATRRDLDHNGLWLSGCGDRVQRPSALTYLQCSLGNRIRALYDYYFCSLTEANSLNDWLTMGCTPSQRNMKAVIDEIASATREDDPRVRPRVYPLIDQHVLGTTRSPGYYRPDHAIVGPTWFKLQQDDLLGNHDNPTLSDLHSWLESARKPVVYVAFGSWARLNVNETRLILEAIVSDRWLTIWKTNSTNVQLILGNNAGDISHKVRSLAETNGALKVLDWAPQFALLKHPKVKAFVTHGGMSSLMEASGNGVPMVCVPLFAEQPYNCEQVAEMAGGLVLDKRQMKSHTLQKAIERVALNGDDLRERMQSVARYHSSIDTSGRLADFVEHYARFKYRFLTVADDHFDSTTYRNTEFWIVFGAVTAVICVMLHMACCVIIRAVLLVIYGRDK